MYTYINNTSSNTVHRSNQHNMFFVQFTGQFHFFPQLNVALTVAYYPSANETSNSSPEGFTIALTFERYSTVNPFIGPKLKYTLALSKSS